MDTRTYADACAVCRALAGRLPDDVLDAVRCFYAVGELDLADATMLVGLAGQRSGVTAVERARIRSILGDPDSPELDDIPALDEVPLHYRFSPAGPPDALDPAAADELLAANAPLHGGHQLWRAWRSPLGEAAPAPDGWVYLVLVGATADELLAYSGLSSTLSVTLRERHQIEVLADGNEPSPFYSAAREVAVPVWTAEAGT